MPQGGASTKVYIVCSDQTRNGKTLVARLVCDYLVLSRRTPLIFDAAPGPGGLHGYFPGRASKVELSTTAGQMALFDRALTAPLHDCVVDLPAHLLSGVADLMQHIGFGEESHTPGLEVVVLFVADRNADSLIAGRKLCGLLRPARFILVRNEAILTADPDGLTKFLYDGLAREGHLVIPVLDSAAMAAIEDRMFSFRRFAEQVPTAMPQHIRRPVAEFLHGVFRQFVQLNLASDCAPHAAAGSQGL